jgi:hypothetical protein
MKVVAILLISLGLALAVDIPVKGGKSYISTFISLAHNNFYTFLFVFFQRWQIHSMHLPRGDQND